MVKRKIGKRQKEEQRGKNKNEAKAKGKEVQGKFGWSKAEKRRS